MSEIERVSNEPNIDVVTVHQTGVYLKMLETQMFWQITAQYIMALTLLVASQGFTSDPFLKFIASCLGVYISCLWRNSAKASTAWHDFRVTQLCNIETQFPLPMQLETQAKAYRPAFSIRRSATKLSWAYQGYFVVIALFALFAIYQALLTFAQQMNHMAWLCVQ
jgi:hypothetical protein